MMTEKTGEHTELMKAPGKNGIVQYRSHSLEIKTGNKITRSHKVVVDLEIPADDILASVHFSSALFTPAMVRGILKDALDESKQKGTPRQWNFEVLGIRIDDPKFKELKLIQSIERDVKKGDSHVTEVESLESFLNADRLSRYLSVELSNKKLSTLSPVEIIFFAYVNRLSSLKAFFPFMTLDHVIKYRSEQSAPIELLKKFVPWVSFPPRAFKLINAKAKIEGHLFNDTETRVRRDSNSYFMYKINDFSLS